MLFVSLVLEVLVTEAVLCEQVWFLSQHHTDLPLLLEASGVGDLDVASFSGRFVHNLLQSGVELAVRVICRGVVARVLFVSSVADVISWDLIQNFGFRLLLA